MFSVPLVAQESAKPIDERVTDLEAEVAAISVPNVAVTGEIVWRFIDGNIDGSVDPAGLRFDNDGVTTTLAVKGSADGVGLFAGATTEAQVSLKVKNNDSAVILTSGVGARDTGGDDDMKVLWIEDNGSYFKVKNVAGMLDLGMYPFKALVTTTLDPVKEENAGLTIGVNAVPDLTLDIAVNTEAETNTSAAGGDLTVWAGSVNVGYNVPDLVKVSGGVSIADRDSGLLKDLEDAALGNQRNMKIGVGAQVDVNAVPDLSASVKFGMRMWNVADLDSTETTGAQAAKGYSAFKLDVPVSYSMGDITLKAGLTYTPIAWSNDGLRGLILTGAFKEDYYKAPGVDLGLGQGVTSPVPAEGVPTSTDEIKITAGGSMAMADMGVTPGVDLTIIMPNSVTYDFGDSYTFVDVANTNDDDNGDVAGGDGSTILPKDTAAGMVIGLKPSMAIKVSDNITLTPAFPIWIDPNYTTTDDDGELVQDTKKSTKIGVEIIGKASF
jgi:hypothetical protein